MKGWFYILRLKSGGLYTGSTTDLHSRMKDHFSGNGSRTTSLDRPTHNALTEEYETYDEALAREQQVKRWSRAKKEALVAGNIDLLRQLSKKKKIVKPLKG